MPRTSTKTNQNIPKPGRARGRPRSAEASAIDGELVGIALHEFQSNGYGATSMNAIARRARVSKTTLYSRFPSKESLFRAAMQDQMSRLNRDRILDLLNACDDLAKGLEVYANHMLDLSLKG